MGYQSHFFFIWLIYSRRVYARRTTTRGKERETIQQGAAYMRDTSTQEETNHKTQQRPASLPKIQTGAHAQQHQTCSMTAGSQQQQQNRSRTPAAAPPNITEPTHTHQRKNSYLLPILPRHDNGSQLRNYWGIKV